MSKIKVLQLIHNLSREGAQSVVSNLVANLDSTQIESVVCPWKMGGPFENDLINAGVDIITAPKINPLKICLWLSRKIKEHNINLINAHMSDSAIIAMISGYLSGVPFVVSFHSNRVMPQHNFMKSCVYKPLFRLASIRSSMNIAVSQSVLETINRELNPLTNLSLINNGVRVIPYEAMKTQRKFRRKMVNEDGPHIVSIGRLLKIKGQNQLLEIIPNLVKHYPGLRVSIIGDGPERSELEARCMALKIDDTVKFTGVVNDIPECLADSDLFVSTSHYEGLPVAAAEAMGAGVPVVVSDVQGNNNLVSNGETGLTYKIENTESLYSQIMHLLKNRDLYDRFSEQGYKSCALHHSALKMAKNYAATYQRVFNR